MLVRLTVLVSLLLLTSRSAFCSEDPKVISERVKFLSGEMFGNGDQFGNAVAMSRHSLLIGAYQDELGAATSAGVVRMYEQNASGGWSQAARLGSSESGSQLGWSVAISDGTAVAGARLADSRGTNSGSITVFQQDGSGMWSRTATLIGSGIRAGEQFGISVGVDQGTIVAGSASHNSSAGAAFVFQRVGSAWEEVAKLTAGDSLSGDVFGQSVAVSGSIVVAGASGKHEIENWSGAAYVFEDSGVGGFQPVAV